MVYSSLNFYNIKTTDPTVQAIVHYHRSDGAGFQSSFDLFTTQFKFGPWHYDNNLYQKKMIYTEKINNVWDFPVTVSIVIEYSSPDRPGTVRSSTGIWYNGEYPDLTWTFLEEKFLVLGSHDPLYPRITHSEWGNVAFSSGKLGFVFNKIGLEFQMSLPPNSETTWAFDWDFTAGYGDWASDATQTIFLHVLALPSAFIPPNPLKLPTSENTPESESTELNTQLREQSSDSDSEGESGWEKDLDIPVEPNQEEHQAQPS